MNREPGDGTLRNGLGIAESLSDAVLSEYTQRGSTLPNGLKKASSPSSARPSMSDAQRRPPAPAEQKPIEVKT